MPDASGLSDFIEPTHPLREPDAGPKKTAPILRPKISKTIEIYRKTSKRIESRKS
jgi:hypothetical protein